MSRPPECERWGPIHWCGLSNCISFGRWKSGYFLTQNDVGGSQNIRIFVNSRLPKLDYDSITKGCQIATTWRIPPRLPILASRALCMPAFVATPCPIYFVEMLNWRPIRFLLMTDSPLQKTAGDSEGDTPLAHARYFNAPDLYKLYSGNGATIAGPFYARLLGAYWGPFRTCAAHVLPLFFQSFLCCFANRGGKTPVNALFMPCVWCTICEQINDTKSAVVIRIEGGCLFQIAHVFSSFLMTSSKGCFKLALKDDSRPSGSVRPDAVWSSSRAAVQQWPSWKSCVRW